LKEICGDKVSFALRSLDEEIKANISVNNSVVYRIVRNKNGPKVRLYLNRMRRLGNGQGELIGLL
jgi:hypothetical protein